MSSLTDDATTQPTLAAFHANAPSEAEWITIHRVETMEPFLTTIVSSEDHWLFATSNGGITAGRISPDHALFPYCTQDKLVQTAHCTGAFSRVAFRQDGCRSVWQPFALDKQGYTRRLSKRLDGTQLSFAELHPSAGLIHECRWGFSRRYGIIRKASLTNAGERPIDVEILDGMQNLMPSGVSAVMQNDYSTLADAYRRAEQVPDSPLALFYLNSSPSDRPEPAECLRATTVWSVGLGASHRLLSTRQVESFEAGKPLVPELEMRAQKAACLDSASFHLESGETRHWYFVAEVDCSTARCADLHRYLGQCSQQELVEELEAELATASRQLVGMVAAADGIQLTGNSRRISRHYSNAMFNIMRGGIFPDNGVVSRKALLDHLAHTRPALSATHKEWIAALPPQLRVGDLISRASEVGDASLERVIREYLPLTFSRRHGDPSRPWNRFAIRVKDAKGNPKLSYQGNWRDIFQNWEALLFSFPEYTENTICRFLNATTADGYNPYRITDEGFDWEKHDPREPWSSFGYWGDHQIIYLLRLLEAAQAFDPGQLVRLMDRCVFAYARLPYKLRGYAEILENPRDSIIYDEDLELELKERAKNLGADGSLYPARSGGVLHVSLVEKLLVPLLAKVANFVPEGGIWMNTQRPEWNDANNALAGYGLSVVTLAYCHRYVTYLLDLFHHASVDHSHQVSEEVAAWFDSQAAVLAAPTPDQPMSDAARRAVMDQLGQGAADYRARIYESGFSGNRRGIDAGQIKAYLRSLKSWIRQSLYRNMRSDGLYHSYNLLHMEADGTASVQHLEEMLEGQVAILSSGLLNGEETLGVLQALRRSRLYTEDRKAYLLYPDRDLPSFLGKNTLDPQFAGGSRLVQSLTAAGDRSVVEADSQGGVHFAGHIHNARDLRAALESLPSTLVADMAAESAALIGQFEAVFNHRAFTGRSTTFFAYEGLGSVYWHMVSKLILAVQENIRKLRDEEEPSRAVADAMAAFYYDTLSGLGIESDAHDYGAVPTDAYSHTPRHAGAQQPGMTGQVKEDILARLGELGVEINDGQLSFRPQLLRKEEFLWEPSTFEYFDVRNTARALPLPAGSVAFTLCQVPVVYTLGHRSGIIVFTEDGDNHTVEGPTLGKRHSAMLFRREGRLAAVFVEVPESWLSH